MNLHCVIPGLTRNPVETNANLSWRWLILMMLLSLPVHAGSACPTQFGDFIEVFQDSPNFQKLNTQFPLFYSDVDATAVPEPKQFHIKVTRTTLAKYPGVIFPSRSTQTSMSLQRKISEQDGLQVVRFDKPDTDIYSVSFFFAKSSRCWRLIRVEDYSL